jgi:hypothetical protein
METIGLVSSVAVIITALPVVYAGIKSLLQYNKSKNPYHPRDSQSVDRSVRPCSFFIKSEYQKDKSRRWEKTADIEVDPLNIESSLHVPIYLVPGARSPRQLRNPAVLKSDPKAALLKRQASLNFIRKYLGRELKGYYFISSSGFPEVYSKAYDNLLRQVGEKYKEL